MTLLRKFWELPVSRFHAVKIAHPTGQQQKLLPIQENTSRYLITPVCLDKTWRKLNSEELKFSHGFKGLDPLRRLDNDKRFTGKNLLLILFAKLILTSVKKSFYMCESSRN